MMDSEISLKERIERIERERQEKAVRDAADFAARGVTIPDMYLWGYSGPYSPVSAFGRGYPQLLLCFEPDDSGWKVAGDREWYPVFHQYAGIGCNHLRAIGTFLTPESDRVRVGMMELQAKFYGTNLGLWDDLDEIIEYSEFLRERLNVSCTTSYSNLAEAFYPVDLTPENFGRLVDEDEVLDEVRDSISFEEGWPRPHVSSTDMKLYIVAENSD